MQPFGVLACFCGGGSGGVAVGVAPGCWSLLAVGVVVWSSGSPRGESSPTPTSPGEARLLGKTIKGVKISLKGVDKT